MCCENGFSYKHDKRQWITSKQYHVIPIPILAIKEWTIALPLIPKKSFKETLERGSQRQR